MRTREKRQGIRWRPPSPELDRVWSNATPVHGKRRGFAFAVAIFLVLVMVASFVATYQNSGETRSWTSYVPHLTITIVGDAQLQAAAITDSWPGNGSSTNPYIISGYDINGAGQAYGISVSGTTLYFIIQDCYVHDANTAGIQLSNVIHAKMLRDVCSTNRLYGIRLDGSTGNSIIGCDCSGNVNSGVLISLSGYTNIENNTCSLNGNTGIYSENSENLTIANNTCAFDSSYGIYLYAASNSTILGNVCTNNNNGIYMLSSSICALIGNSCTGGTYGIYMRFADTNILMLNNCSSSGTAGLYTRLCTGNIIQNCSFWWNSAYGVQLDDSSISNRLSNNTFAYNNGASDVFDPLILQAYDKVGSNSWSSPGTPHGYGNYWSDWASPDNNSDGIVDAPYGPLDGGVNVKDNYPLAAKPATQIPEFGPLGMLLVLFSSLAIVILFSRRMKT